MATKIKGIYKSFKFISQIFVVKEREMDIGYPTDVKHVAHIGWDGPPGSGPSWMNEFKPAPNFSTSLGNIGTRKDDNPTPKTSWSTQDFDESKGSEATSSNNASSSSEIPHNCKKNKRRKTKLASCPMSSSSSSSAPRHSRKSKPKAAFSEPELRPALQV